MMPSPDDAFESSLPDPSTEEHSSLELKAPAKGDPPAKPIWTLVAHNKKVIKGWAELTRGTPENVINAYDWLRQGAMTPRVTRCFALRGKRYAGCWCYEIGPGDRLYYKPDEERKTATFWYAGPHPKRGIPFPPDEL
jgi:hypothetical protein